METIEITKTVTLWDAVECGEVLSPVSSIYQGSTNGNFMLFEMFEDGDDGTFPRVSDFMRVVNAINKEGASAYLRWIGRSKMKFNQGYCTVEREGKFSNNATLTFDKPISIVVAEVNDKPVIIQANKIEGEFFVDWFWRKGGRQDKVANGCEVWFDCQKFELV